MKVYVISYRDEFRPDPIELVAFDNREKATAVVEALEVKRDKLSKMKLPEDEMNQQWHAFLGQQRIPESKFFILNFTSYGNYAFNIRELEVLS